MRGPPFFLVGGGVFSSCVCCGDWTVHLDSEFFMQVFFFFWVCFGSAQGKNSIFQNKNFYFGSLRRHKFVLYLCFYNVSTIYLKLNVDEVLMNHYMIL